MKASKVLAPAIKEVRRKQQNREHQDEACGWKSSKSEESVCQREAPAARAMVFS